MMELCDTNRQEVMGMSRILIVEDEQAIANLVRTVLTDAGYQCTWAADGMQAADLLENNSFDLALLDLYHKLTQRETKTDTLQRRYGS